MTKVTNIRNFIIPKSTTEFRQVAQESKCDNQADLWVLKRRINTKEEEQTNTLDKVIGQSEVIGKIANEVYRKMTQQTKNFQFKHKFTLVCALGAFLRALHAVVCFRESESRAF